jgi:hypothetical protein
MLHHAFLRLLPALLALAFLFGTPGTGTAATEISTAAWRGDAKKLPALRGGLTEGLLDTALKQCADQDDTPDDRTTRVTVRIEWNLRARVGCFHCSRIAVLASHPPAARPRAPPSA